jgi:hypothetical protein
MAKNKSLVEEAIIQMKILEETVAENAKGILASTMKEEISELVKESLSEQEEDEIETDVKMSMGSEEDSEDESDEDSEEESEMGGMDMDIDNMDMDMSSDDDVIDLSDEDDDEVLRVFELMGPDDNIVVKKDDAGNINLKTDENEYMIVGEGEEEEEEMYEEEEEEEMYEMDMTSDMYEEESIEDIVSKVFDKSEDDEEMNEEEEEEEENEEVVYEIEFDEEEMDEEEMEEEMYESDEEMDEEDMEDSMNESKMKVKAKGVGMGSPKFKFNQKPNMSGGFKTKMKKGNATMGTGKAKFEYKEGENMKMKMRPVKKTVKKMETKEASRTLGSGSMFRKGGLPKPRAHSKFNTAIKESENSRELELLREKNEEYRKALNVFRNKLNEVAVFNSNLAYATRLFTEHSTSKQEKINILRRFDGVESLKESKNLYKTIKDELSPSSTQTMNESVERVIEKTPSTGSVNLIESKTYENPQFLRMKDLMTKIIK